MVWMSIEVLEKLFKIVPWIYLASIWIKRKNKQKKKYVRLFFTRCSQLVAIFLIKLTKEIRVNWSVLKCWKRRNGMFAKCLRMLVSKQCDLACSCISIGVTGAGLRSGRRVTPVGKVNLHLYSNPLILQSICEHIKGKLTHILGHCFYFVVPTFSHCFCWIILYSLCVITRI